ncbi:cytochrome P450 [Virgisporangium aurantiacum]|uniref:cytochrome P450 n=1 Tax=Virgisporangium aurantiacum TaxID=175570 RepID=UPI00194FA1BC
MPTPPTPSVWRMARHDTALAGVPIRAGSVVVAHLGVANRDAERYADPDTFDIYRPAAPHLAIGHGRHVCLGMSLVRIEAAVLTTHRASTALRARANEPAGRLRPALRPAWATRLATQVRNPLPRRPAVERHCGFVSPSSWWVSRCTGLRCGRPGGCGPTR